MKKLFLILLILPIGLLADDWIFTVENTTMVTAYFNIFNAIAALFKNDSYIDLLRLAFLIGGFFVFAKGVLAAWEGSASAHILSPYGKYLAVGVALLTLIFSQTSTLWIEAKELPTYCPGAAAGTPATTAFAVELPSVLAYVFKFTNTIGTELTYLAEAAFTNPSNPAGSAAMSDSDGYLGSLKATIGLLNINPSYVTLSKRDEAMADKATDFVQDFRMFYQSCITQNNQNQGSEGRDQDYKIMNSKDIMKTIDAYIGSNSPDTGFQFSSGKYPGNAYTNIYGVPKTCRAVWTDLKSTEGAIAKFAAKMCSVYPNMNGGVFELITGTYGTGAALEMTGIGIQAGLINAIKASNKYDSIGIQGGGSFTAGESRASTNLEQLSTASYMAEMIPYLQMTMRAVLYAFFPFVFVVVLLPGGLTVLAQYLQTMIWIELWTPTAAIVNMFINLRVKDTVGEEYSKEGLTLMTSVDMLSEANTIAGVGAVLYLSIPPLTWLILKGSGQMLGGMLSSHSAGFAKNLSENKKGEDLKTAEAMRATNNDRASKNMSALSYGEMTHYESLRAGNQAAGNLLAGMQSGLGADKSAAYQKTGEALETALSKREALGGDKNVVQSKATSDTVVAKNQQDINKALGYGNDKGSDFSRIQELSKYQAAQELAKTESGQKFLKEMGVLDNKNDINKDAINNMTDTQAAEVRNNLIDSEIKQKVLGTGIGKDGEAQAKKNANTKANEEDVKLKTDAILQKEFSNKFRATTGANEMITKILTDSKFQEKYGNEDRATQEAIAKTYAIESVKAQFGNSYKSAAGQGANTGESNRRENAALGKVLNDVNANDHIDSVAFKKMTELKKDNIVLGQFGGNPESASDIVSKTKGMKEAGEIHVADKKQDVNQSQAANAIYDKETMANLYSTTLSKNLAGINSKIADQWSKIDNNRTTDGTALNENLEKSLMNELNGMYGERRDIINGTTAAFTANKNLHFNNSKENDSLGAILSIGNKMQSDSPIARDVNDNLLGTYAYLGLATRSDKAVVGEDGSVNTFTNELTDSQQKSALEVNKENLLSTATATGFAYNGYVNGFNEVVAKQLKVDTGVNINTGNAPGYFLGNNMENASNLSFIQAKFIEAGVNIGTANSIMMVGKTTTNIPK